MPYSIKYKRGQKRPWRIVNKITGKIVGSSETKKNAEASIRARYMGEHK